MPKHVFLTYRTKFLQPSHFSIHFFPSQPLPPSLTRTAPPSLSLVLPPSPLSPSVPFLSLQRALPLSRRGAIELWWHGEGCMLASGAVAVVVIGMVRGAHWRHAQRPSDARAMSRGAGSGLNPIVRQVHKSLSLSLNLPHSSLSSSSSLPPLPVCRSYGPEADLVAGL